MRRKIVCIDEEKCNGCGNCIPNCHEGALQIIDGKVRLVSDLLCDGLGACLGHCPEGAISIEDREAEAYDESKVMAEMVKKGKNTVIAHLKHLKEHGETDYLNEGVSYLMKHKKDLDFIPEEVMAEVHTVKVQLTHQADSCPGSRSVSFERSAEHGTVLPQFSSLKQWPVQLHLLSPMAPYLRNADLLLAADCTAFAMGDFHSHWLKDKSLAIACPKLDSSQESYVEKLVGMIDEAKVNAITVLMMEVPCCSGLLRLVHLAQQQASRRVLVKAVVVSLQGNVLKEEWI